MLGSSHTTLCQFSKVDSNNEESTSLREKIYRDAEFFSQWPIACHENPGPMPAEDRSSRSGTESSLLCKLPDNFYSPLV